MVPLISAMSFYTWAANDRTHKIRNVYFSSTTNTDQSSCRYELLNNPEAFQPWSSEELHSTTPYEIILIR
jgi:hypothetical protein